jgi:HNH endonuclease
MATTKKFGPYEGSKANGGRPIYVYKTKQADGTWKTTSKNKARADYEAKNGPLPKTTHVDHKDNNKKNDAKSNLRAISRKANIGKENKRRAGGK